MSSEIEEVEDVDTFWGEKIGAAMADLENLVLLAESEGIEDARTLRGVGALVASCLEGAMSGNGHSRFAMVMRGAIFQNRGRADRLMDTVPYGAERQAAELLF